MTSERMMCLPKQLMQLLPIYAAALSFLCFLCFALDKLFAVKHRRRIPERVLLTLSALGGSLGALLAMPLLRHKTNGAKHPGFVFGVPLIFLCQLALVCALYMLS